MSKFRITDSDTVHSRIQAIEFCQKFDHIGEIVILEAMWKNLFNMVCKFLQH